MEQGIYPVHRNSSRIRAAKQVIEPVQDVPRLYYQDDRVDRHNRVLH